MSGSQDDGCQMVRKWVPGGLVIFGGMDKGCQLDVDLSPLDGNQVAWTCESFRGRGLPGGSDVYSGIDASLGN